MHFLSAFLDHHLFLDLIGVSRTCPHVSSQPIPFDNFYSFINLFRSIAFGGCSIQAFSIIILAPSSTNSPTSVKNFAYIPPRSLLPLSDNAFPIVRIFIENISILWAIINLSEKGETVDSLTK